ncbi:titin-like [Mobula birostris]|uniref:titin-like n=1 Tax=Mobula birostris TaxID=1983395 RepID=UPI003B2863BB
MECKISGSLPMTVLWYKDNEELTSSEKHKFSYYDNIAQLEIHQLEMTDGGSYTCRATNSAGTDQSIGVLTVKEPPYFTLKPLSQDVIPGSKVQFRSVIGGTPPITIKWFKDKKELVPSSSLYISKEGSTSMLQLHSAKISDTGDYTCRVSNEVGSETCVAHLFVKEPPSFIQKPDRTTLLKKGSSTSLECSVIGTPEIKITWYKQESEILPNDKFRMSFVDSKPVLELTNVNVEDSGQYTCRAENEAGFDNCSVTITVKEPPSFSKKLEPMETVKGNDVSLECGIAGSGPFDATWYKDNKQIQSSIKFKLTTGKSLTSLFIQNVDNSDAGEYRCEVTNDVGSCSCAAVVKLKEPPFFMKRIENVTTLSGNSATFNSQIEGSSPIFITWMKDKEEIREDDNINISFEDSIAVLHIASVESYHSGKYACQARNDAGTEKCFATLSVTEPAQILEKPEPLSVTSGTMAILECVVAGTPELKVRWFKNQEELTSSRKYKVTFVNKVAALKIQSVDKDDSGEYAFEVQNEFGHSSCTTSLTVLDRIIAPTFTKSLKKMDNILGALMHMECKVSGSLPISISWYKDNTEIMADHKYKMSFEENTAFLEINEIKITDGGNYSCKATNAAGSSKCSGSLTIKEPPSFIEKPMSQEIVLGSTLQFKSIVKGTPPLFIKWIKDNKELKPAPRCSIWNEETTYFLELISTKASDAGVYSCQLTNEAGSVISTANVFIKEPPNFVTTPPSSTFLKQGEFARFECKITGTPEITVTWYRNNQEIRTSDKYRMSFQNSLAVLDIADVRVEDSGDYSCEAQNDAGINSCNFMIQVKGV